MDNIDEVIKQVLETDSLTRGIDVEIREFDIFTLKDLSKKDLSTSLPVVPFSAYSWAPSQYKRSFDKLSDDKLFSILVENFPYLKYLNLNNVLIAGGAVESAIRFSLYEHKTIWSTDLDLFLCGLNSVEELEEKVREISAGVAKFMKASNIEKVTILRTANAITFTRFSDTTVNDLQIVLRRYDTPSQVLHGFDVGSSAVGIWDYGFITTSLGKFALEYRANILDVTRRSYSYEYRLFNKYLGRGYSVILPYLDLAKVGDEFTKVNKFISVRIGHHNLLAIIRTSAIRCGSDYTYYGVINDETISRHNTNILIKDGSSAKLWYGKSCTHDQLVHAVTATDFPIPTLEDVRGFYQKMSIVSKGVIKIDRAKRLYPESSIVMLVTAALLSMEEAKKIELEIRDSQAEKTYLKIQEDHPNGLSIPVNWRLDNPEGQLTGSFHPIFSSNEEWYGDLYLPS